MAVHSKSDRGDTSRRRAAFTILTGSTAEILIVSIQAIILIPLFLRAIGPRLYGAWLGSGDILVWMQAVDLGLPNLMIQRIGAAHGRGDSKSVAEYFATGMLSLAVVALAVAGAAIPLAIRLPEWMGITGHEGETLKSCFIVGSTSAALNILNNGVVGFSRGVQDTAFMNGTRIVSILLGFAVSISLVFAGWGLWAIALGLAARTGMGLLGSAVFTAAQLRAGMRGYFHVRRPILREFLVISPASALGGISYAAMNQSESALVAIFLKPELAVIFTLTRKALEVARGLVDMIAFAVYGGFANLVTSDQRHRTMLVHSEINSLRLSLAIVLASAYMAVNSSLVSIWVGSEQYGGALLTVLMAVQFIVVGSSFMINYLYRAMGKVMEGSIALFVESGVRVPLMIGSLLLVGLPGVPIAGIVTGAVFGWLAYRWTVRHATAFAEPAKLVFLRVWAVRITVFLIGMLTCIFFHWNSWIFVLVAGSAIVVIGGLVLVSIDPLLENTRTSLDLILDRLRTVKIGNR